jgi:hypothetical protein
MTGATDTITRHVRGRASCGRVLVTVLALLLASALTARGDKCVALVPCGLLGALPVHAALATNDSDERWDRANVHSFSGTYGDYLLAKVAKVFPDLNRDVL